MAELSGSRSMNIPKSGGSFEQQWKTLQKDPVKYFQIQMRSGQLSLGLQSAFRGCYTAIRNPQFRHLMANSVGVLLTTVVSIFLLSLMFYIPWRILLWFTSLIFTIEKPGFIEGVIGLFFSCCTIVPTLGLGFLKLTSGSMSTFTDRVFFIVLKELDTEVYDKLAKKPVVDFKTYMKIYLRRMGRVLILGFGVWIWYHIPILGYLAMPFAQFKLSERTFGTPMAILLAVVSLVGALLGNPYSHWVATEISLLVSCISLSREVMEPYFSRLDDYRVGPAKLRKKYFKMMIGFAIPFTLLLSIPIIGIVFWGLIQASAAALVIVIEKKEKQKNNDEEMPGLLDDYPILE
eukprot:CAMPEP_0174269574 /NCGR_PEP_ID=MMETSP0439-20130205/41531_1 /TAXON_ID=0 /ORGANISM="Stereomyxa ramosa, Strain Chinc5" /LENGTH=346 /DNA_ID=CAMNT_0015358425 /DNA_START=9 /DNA_END=1049 /DNA_ORIENTATION=+